MVDSRLRVRPLADYVELSACVDLQKKTWGTHFDDIVSGALMLVAQKIGGIAAGAFDAGGDLVGIVFGLTGFRGGEPVHWSHMLAVQPGQQGRGIGTLLKLYQRERVRNLGIRNMYWTFDPLEARNAHFNLNRLFARVDDYVIDLYGPGDTSPLHKGIGTDRFVAVWPVEDEHVVEIIRSVADTMEWNDKRTEVSAPVPFRIGGTVRPVDLSAADIPADGLGTELTEDSRALVEIPSSIQRVKAANPDEAQAWRTYTRTAFTHYLARGYSVTSFVRHGPTGRCFYVLERAG